MNRLLSCKSVTRFSFVGAVLALVSAFSFTQSAQAAPVGAMMQPVLPSIHQEFTASLYTTPDGALTVHAGGDYVDPYFSTKALLSAHASGLNIDRVGKRWVEWLRQRQRTNGLFDRYVRTAPGVWQVWASSDADDSMLALWLELLHTLSPSSGLPTAWRQSAKRAQTRLDELRDPATGVYFISMSLPVGLLMDNAEIYGSLCNIARAEERFGQRLNARQRRLQAAALASSIERVFWRPDWNEYSISTQDAARDTFYPYGLAQLYPMMESMPTTMGQEPDAVVYDRWLGTYSDMWLQMTADPYPWGLAALTGVVVGNNEVAIDWMAAAAPLRDSGRWNILEEAIFQALDAQL